MIDSEPKTGHRNEKLFRPTRLILQSKIPFAYELLLLLFRENRA